MGIPINTNFPGIQAGNKMDATSKTLRTSLAKLSSGMRINSAKDDAAGLAISEELRSQIRGLAQAQRNTMDGISMIQTAEGGMAEAGEALIRMRELAIQAGNGTLGDEEREQLNQEFNSLRDEVDRIGATTEFNGNKLLDGSTADGITFQSGTSADEADQISISISAMDSENLGAASATLDEQSISTQDDAGAALESIDQAIADVSAMRADLGAAQNTMETTTQRLAIERENISAANSRIRDVDVAEESIKKAKSEILMQTGAAVMAQANQLPAMALALIG